MLRNETLSAIGVGSAPETTAAYGSGNDVVA